MTLISDETLAFQPIDDDSVTMQPEFKRQNSHKRQNSDNDKQFVVDDIPFKRVRSSINTSIFVPCPIADFGCLHEVPSNELEEHYSSSIHQECLMKTINFYTQQLHKSSKKTEDQSELSETVNVLSECVSCIHDDNIQIQHNVTQLDNNICTLQNHVQTLKSSIDETNQYIESSQMNQNVLQTEMESLKEKVTELTSQSSNDGTYIWKITDIAQKINDAVADRQTSIYSPPFYSSPNGYKMCMRLYINGDGQARRTHLSLFFVVLRGDYDAILQWPFSFKITFCLYDQTNKQQHIIESFRPDIRSNSFQRPRSSMNIASGVPRFCPLTHIQQDNNPYVRDDCMFIRCMVEFANMPKTITPYVFNLNPGLPKSVQQAMYQAEIERQKVEVSDPSKNPQESTSKLDTMK
ncbi:hypothetical protein I4U23_007341 [Adineta vaga]|nr:hypothetical protein I4U23_007341 [Adineta vaga]